LNTERTFRFEGTALECAGWLIVWIVLSLLILPAAWGAVAFYGWVVRSVRISDGTTVAFEGRGAEVWAQFAAIMALGFAPDLYLRTQHPEPALLASFVVPLLVIPFTCALWLSVLRWFFAKIRLGCGTPLRFTGTYLPYLGWVLLLSLSMYTIVGWAWVMAALLRWVCRNIEAGENRVVFSGRGWDILWRGVLATLGCVFVVTIPWMWLWFNRWALGRFTIVPKAAPAPGGVPEPA